jgi:nucleotide-binding universal stress UspA family protein
MLPFHKILAPTDFSRCAEEAFPRAVEVARAFSAELIVTHVLPLEPATPWDIPPYADFGLAAMPSPEYEVKVEAEVRERLASLVKSGVPSGIAVRLAVGRGDPAREIVRAAREQGVDLIVMATHGWKGWRHLVFGSVAERVLREAPCPVLVVREPLPGKAA